MVWYATREDVKAALDYKETARNNGQVDRAIEAASRTVESLCHRRFYPEQAVRSFAWPNGQHARAWRLWLDANELISITTLTAGGTTISASDYFLEPNEYGPPYSRLELDLGSSAAFGGGNTHQRNITIAGLYGYRNDEAVVGATVEALDGSETGMDVDAATSALVGVGSVLRVDDERLLVTGRSMLDTGQNLATDIDQQAKTVTIPVQSGAAFAVGEIVLIDGERMLIVDIAGNNLIVKRAWDGSVIAAHASGADVYAPRTLTVTRGALGTTAATHVSGATVHRWEPPGPVRQLTIGEAIVTLTNEVAGYSRVKRTGEANGERARDTSSIATLREQVYASHGRKARIRAV